MKYDNVREVKERIVSGCKKGFCDHNGNTLPESHWRQAGKGSHYVGRIADYKKYGENFDKIFGVK